MLNSTTKNRINTCRDILVGKIPDPKGQVDQITNALVYKFMDDQDRMSRELGYDASFFVGDYEQYAWSKLFDAKLTNQEKASLYTEGLDKLSRAKHLPELFKEIFKDAYLPFRDANTIVMFLTEINGFDYHHSEELGNAFEYLLSIMGSQGDAGQFRTPRHIIEFIVDVVDPEKSETILDPACGTAGFLVEAFKHISAKGNLGVQDIAKLAESITGVDIDPGMAKIARVNLYLHGFKTPKITENDTLTNEKLWGQKYDVILANPPFMTPRGGIQPHDKFAIRANRAEVLFTDYIAEHLKLHGRAGIIVPEGIVSTQSNAYKDLRKILIDGGYLWAVVSLPSGVFNPYAGVKTSILFLDRDRAKQNDSILFVKISADGYDLGAQRREINKNDLPKALEILNAYKENPNLPDSHSELVSGSSFAHLVQKSKITESGDYNLSGDRYDSKGSSPISTVFPMVSLSELMELVRGVTYGKDDEVESDGHKILRAGNISLNGDLILEDIKTISFTKQLKPEQKLSKGDIFICLASGSKEHVGKTAYIDSDLDFYFGGFMGVIRSKNDIISSKYLFQNLHSRKFNDYLRQVIAGANINNLNGKILGEYKIPLPPLEIQEQIVAELDGYQRIIDGARAVVENYKPTIKIDLEWEMVELGEVCDVRDGTHDSPKQIPEGYPLITSKNIKNGMLDFSNVGYISDEDFQKISQRSYVDIGDIIMPMIGTIGGACLIVSKESEFAIKNVALFKKSEHIIPGFLLYLLGSDLVREMFDRQGAGAAQKFVSLGVLRGLKIPLPPLEIQQSIVDRIEEEQRLVDANRRLIEIYEGKIREKMDEVWGVGK